MTIKATAAAVFLGLSPFAGGLPAAAQPPGQQHQPPAPQVKAAMAKLAWLEGAWEGTGWRDGPHGRETFNASEKAHWELDGLVLVFHGRGWDEKDTGETVEGHKAFGVLSFEPFSQTYHFDAFVKEGYQTRSNAEVGDNQYRWSYPAGPEMEMRFRARLTGDGEWLETGERCAGEACTKFFEMRLKKTGAE